MIPQYELKAEDVHHYTIEKMKEYIPIEAHGYCCTSEMIFDVLFKASAESSSSMRPWVVVFHRQCHELELRLRSILMMNHSMLEFRDG
jgi:hypothetical protein